MLLLLIYWDKTQLTTQLHRTWVDLYEADKLCRSIAIRLQPWGSLLQSSVWQVSRRRTKIRLYIVLHRKVKNRFQIGQVSRAYFFRPMSYIPWYTSPSFSHAVLSAAKTGNHINGEHYPVFSIQSSIHQPRGLWRTQPLKTGEKVLCVYRIQSINSLKSSS